MKVKASVLFLTLLSIFSLSSCSRYRVNDDSKSSNTNQDKNNDDNKIDDSDNKNNDSVNIIEGEYNNLINDGLGDLYPCQYVNVYAEGIDDYTSFGSGSNISSLILGSGGFNIFDNLINPQLDNIKGSTVYSFSPTYMIKIVNNSILGKDISSLTGASNIKNNILNRSEWENIPFIKTQSITLFSSSLLETSKGKLYFKLILASKMYPSLFKNLDIEKTNKDLLDNSGIYYF